MNKQRERERERESDEERGVIVESVRREVVATIASTHATVCRDEEKEESTQLGDERGRSEK